MNQSAFGIIISYDQWAQMQADVNARSAEEACGFVVGNGNQAKLIIPVTNILHDAFRFRMDPNEELKAFLLAEDKGWEILAVYHSHPHGIDQPSPTDIAELTFPGIIYLIWFQKDDKWECRGYLMDIQAIPSEIRVVISTNEEL